MFLEVFRHIAGIFPLHQLMSVNHIVQIKNRASDTVTKIQNISVSYLRLIVHVQSILNSILSLKRLKQ